AHPGDVVAAQRPRVALLRDERHPLLLGLPDPEARVAGPLLPRGVLVRTHPEDVAVEGAGALGGSRRDAEAVESFDDSHAARTPRIAVENRPHSRPDVRPSRTREPRQPAGANSRGRGSP